MVIRSLVVASSGRAWAYPAPGCHTNRPTALSCPRGAYRLTSLNRAAR